MACELHRQVTSEPAGVLDQHHADAVSLAVGEQGGKAGPLGHRIGAGYGGIIKAGGDDMPPCGVDLDRFGLATLAPLEGHPNPRRAVIPRIFTQKIKAFRQYIVSTRQIRTTP
jgi:hypothetical protein